MKVAAWIAAPVVAIIVLLTVVGWLLPVGHEASVSRTFAAPADAVYKIIEDRGAYPQWWHDDPGIKSEVVEAMPPRRFATRIVDPEQPFGGNWTFDIVPDGQGSRLTIAERGEVYNPTFRFVSRFVVGHEGTIDSFMDALAERLTP